MREFVVFVQQRWGQDLMAQKLAKMPELHRATFDVSRPALGVLAGSWYDAESAHALLIALFDGLPLAERRQLVEDGVAQMMQVNLQQLYKRFFFRIFVSPTFYVKYAQRLWAQHFDGGEVTARFADENSITWEIRDWAGYHPLLHEMVMASEPSVFGAMGCRNVRVQRLMAPEGVDASHRISWDPDG